MDTFRSVMQSIVSIQKGHTDKMLHSSKDPSLLGLPTPLPTGVLPRNRLGLASWVYSSVPLCSSVQWTPRRMQDAFISD